MSVYLRGKTWWIKFDINGQTIRRSSRKKSKREAQKVERQLKLEYKESFKSVNHITGHTFEDALLRWIKSGGPESMFRHAKGCREYLAGKLLKDVVPYAHEMKADMLEKGYNVATINRRLAIVRRILNLAYKEWEWIDQPLGQKIKLLSEKGLAREVFLSKEEVQKLIDLIEDENIKKIVLLAVYTGLRQGEIRKLKPENWQAPYIVLNSKTKSKKARSIPLVNDLHHVMTSTQFDVTEWAIRKNFEAARKAMRRPDIRFHDLRHTFASWLIQDPSIPLGVIRDTLGHSNLSVTNKYSHLRPESLNVIKGALSLNMVNFTGDVDAGEKQAQNQAQTNKENIRKE